MTPKEKANEMILKFAFKGAQHEGEAKKFSLIAVDEILKVILFNKYDDKYWEEEDYWIEVKQEIENYKNGLSNKL